MNEKEAGFLSLGLAVLWAVGAFAIALPESAANPGVAPGAEEPDPTPVVEIVAPEDMEPWMEYGDNDYLAVGGGFVRAEQTEVSASLAHEHDWDETSETVHHEEVKHTETKVIPGEPIVEYHTICDACKEIIDGEAAIDAHYKANPDHIEAGYITGYPVEMGLAPDTTETVEVVDEEAWDETIVTRTCKVCGYSEVVK